MLKLKLPIFGVQCYTIHNVLGCGQKLKHHHKMIKQMGDRPVICRHIQAMCAHLEEC